MAQSGYTPILIYASGTASNVPLAANMTSSASGAELALNYADGKLYYKNSSGVVTLLASAAGASGDVVGPSSATDNALARFDTTTGKLIQNSVGILSDAGVLTGLTGITSSGSITFSSLTAGRVTFAGASGLLTDSANLFWDNTNGRLGIGTSSPTVGQLVIKGDGAVSQIRAQASTNTNQGLSFIYNYASQFGQINCDESGVNQLDLWYTALSHKFGRNTSSALMTLDASGNLNIGTTGIAEKLVVNGAILSRGGQSALYASTTSIDYNAGNLGRFIATGPDASTYPAIVFANTTTTTYAERMRIDSSGSVGIGTTTPATYGKLAVNGAIYSIGGNSMGVGNSDNTNFSYLINSGATGVNNANMTFNMTNKGELMRLTSAGKLGIGTNDPYGTASVFMGTTAPQDLLWYDSVNMIQIGESAARPLAGLFAKRSTYAGANAYNGDLMFYNLYYAGGADYQWKERMRIEANGNVGIGTATPTDTNSFSRAIDVQGTNGAGIYLRNSAASPSTAFFNIGYSSTAAYLINQANSAMLFFTNAAEKMRIAAGGNVGIATVDPLATLQIGSGIGGGNAPSTSKLMFGANNSVVTFLSANDSASVDGVIGSWNTVYNHQNAKIVFDKPAGNTGQILFYTQNGSGITERMVVRNNGYIGIGVSNPGFQFTTKTTDNIVAGFESQASGSVNGQTYNAIIGRSTNSIPHSTTTQIAGGYGGGIVLIVMRNVTGNDTQYTYVVTWGWNSASVLFTNSYGSTGTTSTFTASGGGLYVSHDHTTGNCYYALSALINGTA